jgi:acetylornithine deacetylase
MSHSLVTMAIIKLFLAFLFFHLASAAPQLSTAPSTVSPAVSSRLASIQAATLTAEETDELFSLHEELVSIPSISEDELECAEFLSEYLAELGYCVEKVPAGETGTYNVFAYAQELKDEGLWPEVLISSHIDTVRIVPVVRNVKCSVQSQVPPFYPFERREEKGTVYHYGRGTVDAKGPIATMVIASHKFFKSRIETPSLGMLFVVGEEIGGTGMIAFAKYASNTTFRAGIFGEPTGQAC